MFIVDDLLMAPFRGILWIVEKVHDAAVEEIASESDSITQQLSDLYMMLETGQITEAEFDASEGPLLDRLDEIQASHDASSEDEDSEDEDSEDEDPRTERHA